MGLWWGTVEGADLPALIDAAAGAGFASISVSPPLYFAARAAGLADAELRARLAAAGLQVAMLDPLIRGLPGSPEPQQVARRFRATFEHGLDACLRAADALGARALNVAHYLCAPVPRAELVDAIGALCARTAREGLELWLEFMPDGGVPDLASAAAIHAAISAPNLGLTLDTWHFFRTAEPLAALEELAPKTIRAVQISDAGPELHGSGTAPPSADRRLPGAGAIPLREILAIVAQRHPGAALGVEVFDRASRATPPAARAAHAAAALRALLDQGSGTCTSGER
jgi:sugar phosphate isomerase/epimerase